MGGFFVAKKRVCSSLLGRPPAGPMKPPSVALGLNFIKDQCGLVHHKIMPGGWEVVMWQENLLKSFTIAKHGRIVEKDTYNQYMDYVKDV